MYTAWMKFIIYMGVNIMIKVVQIQVQINVNVVKPGFTTSLRSKYHILPTNSQIWQSRSEHAFTMP